MFAIPAGVEKWYPSASPQDYGEGRYSARVYTGPDDEYDVLVVLTATAGDDEVTKYIQERQKDKDWGRGIGQLPTASIVRDELRVRRGCTSRFDKRTPTLVDPPRTRPAA